MALLDRFKKKKEEEKPVKKKAALKVPQKPEKEKKAKPEVKISQKEALNAYRIIKRPHITEKAAFLAEKNKYVFRIYPRANKTEVKKVVQSLYGVKVENVHIVHSAPKKRRLGRSQGFRHGLKKGFKKAIVTLREGDKIELLPR